MILQRLYNVPAVYHILLLPQSDYWSWVRATRDYVLTFGTRLTPDPTAAASYMAPRQVVSYPSGVEQFAQVTDIAGWFGAEHPEVRLDAIEASTPEELKRALAKRIERADRFGQRQRPFSLRWPTEYPVITQKFGANPRIYNKFGMPGHEGIDMRALPNTKVFAGADGEVYRVELDPSAHAYGIHIRIRHRDGYRSVYGHLAEALVREGDRVEAGQVIGKADATGASVLAHLHFTLKRDFATEQGETDYPMDVIDPTNYLIFPETVASKQLPPWPPGKCLVGAHGRIGGTLQPRDLELIEQAKLECVAVELEEPADTIARLHTANSSMLVICRLTTELNRGPVTARKFVTNVQQPMAQLYQAGVRYFELVPNANLESEGWGRSWHAGAEFAGWFGEVFPALKDRFPEALIGYPGLSPGDAVAGRRASDLDFLEQSREAVVLADWVGVNCFWTDVAGMDRLREGRLHEEYRLRFPDKLLFVTEFGNASSAVESGIKASQYLTFYSRLRGERGIGAALAFALAAEAGYDALTWDANLAGVIGTRAF